MSHGKVSYLDGDLELEGYYAKKGARPLVILCPAWQGHDESIHAKAEALSASGFNVFALDVYGKGVLGHSPEENLALKQPFLDDREMLKKRLLAGFKKAVFLNEGNSDQVAVMGSGFGGMCALDLARHVDVKGVVSIYGHFDAPMEWRLPSGRILLLHGYLDPISKLDELHEFQEMLEDADIDWQSHIFGKTAHAFTRKEVDGLVRQFLADCFSF
ncbi:MAG: hypothetical protein SP1CHLAM54_10320 [Chlamydiia bacterium]|nr:hypothetical protein [Chlamydiia bacterium]MCH9615937.1 hypothetical protein [Chlamydiia bacterium]MCH9628660.1 hypothetical protein [Chlamydiia bacterium]